MLPHEVHDDSEPVSNPGFATMFEPASGVMV
jgi:hypothetical protein